MKTKILHFRPKKNPFTCTCTFLFPPGGHNPEVDTAPKLHTIALATILYMFVTQTTPTHYINKLAIVTALGQQPLAKTGKKSFPARNWHRAR